jgi:hypothetical protein
MRDAITCGSAGFIRGMLRAAQTSVFVLLFVTGVTGTASGQWIKEPTRGIPRTADGKADLSAPAPRLPDGTPDLSGLWQMNPGSYVVNIAQDLSLDDIQPWAQARFKEHLDRFAKDPGCFLPSGPRYYIAGLPKIIHTPTLMVVLNEDLTYRQIYGRSRPAKRL